MKKCSKCHKNKNQTDFSKDAKRSDKLYVYCKDCARSQNNLRTAQLRQRKSIKIPKSKHCPKCKLTKNFSEFHKNKNYRSGLASYCKECKWNYQKSPEFQQIKKKSYDALWGSKPREQTIRSKLSAAKRRAAKKGLAFDLTYDWMVQQLNAQDNKCAVTGVSFDYTRAQGKTRPNALSIDSNLGYMTTNVQLVTWIYNMAKSNYEESVLNEFLIVPMAIRLADKYGVKKLTEQELYDLVGSNPSI